MAKTTKSVTTLEIGEPGSAFSIPVTLKKIKTASDVSLDTATQFGEPTGTTPVSAATDRVLEEVDLPLQKGVFKSKPVKGDKRTWGDFAPISADDLATIEEATKIEAFTVEHFIPLADVPMERVTDAYFLAPASGMGAKPLVLLARAMKKRKVAGVFKMVKTSRQHLAVVYEKDGGLIVNTLAFAQDFGAVREAAEELNGQKVTISKAEQAQAEKLVELLAADGSVLDRFEDDLIPLKSDLVERALAGKALPKQKKKVSLVQGGGDDLEARLRLTLAGMQESPPMRPAGIAA